MKKLLVVGAAAAAVLACFALPGQSEDAGPAKTHLGKLRHVVLLKFKDGTAEADVKKIEDGFRQLPKKIPEIVDFEWGTNNSPEKLDQGFTHCFLVTFADAKGRDVYLPHPAHKEFVQVLLPHLDKVLVVDYVAKQ